MGRWGRLGLWTGIAFLAFERIVTNTALPAA